MDRPDHQGVLPTSVTSTYVGAHDHIHTPVDDPFPLHTSTSADDRAAVDGRKGAAAAVTYRECLKNHAAAIGGTALDGCGEFMPAGEEGTLEALRCSACSCHRNFHRREVDGELPHRRHHLTKVVGHNGVLISASTDAYGYFSENPSGEVFPARPIKGFAEKCSLTAGVPSTAVLNGILPGPYHHHMVMPLGALRSSEYCSDDMEGGGAALPTAAVAKKRFRTKFTPEQKEKMLNFAENAGWRLQRQEPGAVERFCQEVGVKRRVLKVWMHNNKHSLAKKEANPLQLE